MIPPVASTPHANRNARNWARWGSPLLAESMKRQGLLVSLVYAQLGDRDQAVLFLNTYHPGLGAKPLDLAAKSADGYEAVRAEICSLSALPDGTLTDGAAP